MLTRIQKGALMSCTCNRQSLVWCCVCLECSKDIPPQPWAEHTRSKSPFFPGQLHIRKWILHSVSTICLSRDIYQCHGDELMICHDTLSWICSFGKLLEDKAYTERHEHSGWMKGRIQRDKIWKLLNSYKTYLLWRSNRKSTMVKRLEESSFWLTVNTDRQREWFQDSWASKMLAYKNSPVKCLFNIIEALIF